MGLKYSNNATTTLAAGISDSDLSLTVVSAANFPTLAGGDWTYATLVEGTTIEIVKVTAITGTTFTIVRAQDGTAASAFTTAALVSLRVTRVLLDDLLLSKADVDSPTFTGTVTIPVVDINSGAIDGTVIGGVSAAAGTFTTGIFTTAQIADGNNLTWGGAYGAGIPTIAGSISGGSINFYPTGSTAGAVVGINASGINGTLGATAPAAATVTALTATGVVTLARVNNALLLRDLGGSASAMYSYVSLQDAASVERGWVGFGSGNTELRVHNVIGNVVIGASGSTAATFTSSGINGVLGATTPAAATVTALTATGNTILGDAAGDTLTINGTAVSIPNGLNFDSNTFVINASTNYVGLGVASPVARFHLNDGADRNLAISTDAFHAGTAGVAIASLNDAANAYRPLSIVASLISIASGNLLVGTTTDDGVNKLQVNGGSAFTGAVSVTSTGNVLTLTLASAGSPVYIATDATVEGGGKRWRTGRTGGAGGSVATYDIFNETDNQTYAVFGSSLLTLPSGIGLSVGAATTITSSAVASLLTLNNTTAGKATIVFQSAGANKGFVGLSGIWEGDSSTDVGIAAETGGNVRIYANGSATEVATFSSTGLTIAGAGSFTGAVGIDTHGAVANLTGLTDMGPLYFDTHPSGEWVGFTTKADTANKQGGVIIQGSGSYGTRIHLLTTDNYGAGAKLSATLNEAGLLDLLRNGMAFNGWLYPYQLSSPYYYGVRFGDGTGWKLPFQTTGGVLKAYIEDSGDIWSARYVYADAGFVHSGKFATYSTYIDAYTWLSFQSANIGLYWPTTGAHFYNISATETAYRLGSASNGYLNIQTSDAVTRAGIYADNGNYHGFTNNAGSWSLRIDSTGQIFAINTINLGGATGGSGYLSWSGTSPVLDAGAGGHIYIRPNSGTMANLFYSSGEVALNGASITALGGVAGTAVAGGLGIDGGSRDWLWYIPGGATYLDLYDTTGGNTTLRLQAGLTGNISYAPWQAPNFHDSHGFNNVNLGSANEGRGVVAGYSGGWYAGIGYNLRHTGTSGVMTAPMADTASYIYFGSGGLQVLGDAGTTGGRTISWTTLFTIAPTTGNIAALGTVTGTDHYANSGGWFRNASSGTGLYNTAHDNHCYSDSANYWAITAAGLTNGGLILRQSNAGTIKGYLYWDANGIGLLNDLGGWSVRCNYGGSYGGQLYGTWDAGGLQVGGSTVWHAGNDGAGSGLDADTVDGNQASAFALLSAGQTWTGLNQFIRSGTTATFYTSDTTPGTPAIACRHAGSTGGTTPDWIQFLDSAGGLIGQIEHDVTNGEVDYTKISDARLKEVLGEFDDSEAGRIIDAVPVYMGRMLRAVDRGAKFRPMFVAQAMQAKAPWMVSGDPEGVDENGNILPLAMDYSKVTPLLWAEARAMRARVRTLTARVAELEARLAS